MATPDSNVPSPGHPDYELFNSAVNAIRAIGNPDLIKDQQRLHQDALNLMVDAKQQNPDIKEFERVGQTRSNGYNYVAHTGDGQSVGGILTMSERADSIAQSMAQLEELNRGRTQSAPTTTAASTREDTNAAVVPPVQLNSNDGAIKNQTPPGGAVYNDGNLSARVGSSFNTDVDPVTPPFDTRVTVKDAANNVTATYSERTPNPAAVTTGQALNDDDPIRRTASVTVGPENGTRITANVAETPTSQTVGGRVDVPGASVRASQTETDTGTVRNNVGANVTLNPQGDTIDYDRTVTRTVRGNVSTVDAVTYAQENGFTLSGSRATQPGQKDTYNLDTEVPVSRTTTLTGGVGVQGEDVTGRLGARYDDGRVFAAVTSEFNAQGASVEGRGGYRFDASSSVALAGRQTFGNESASQVSIQYLNNASPQNIGEAPTSHSLSSIGDRFRVSQELSPENRELFRQAADAFDRMKPDQRAGLDPVAVPLAMVESAKNANPPLSRIADMEPGKPGADGKVSLFVGDGNLDKEGTRRTQADLEQLKTVRTEDVLQRMNAPVRQAETTDQSKAPEQPQQRSPEAVEPPRVALR